MNKSKQSIHIELKLNKLVYVVNSSKNLYCIDITYKTSVVSKIGTFIC